MAVGSEAIPADLASIQHSAAQEFATAATNAMEGGAPAPAAPEAPPVETAPAAPPASAPAAPAPQTETASAPRPETAPAAPTGTPNIDVSSWSPEAKRALEMEGWDGKSAVSPDLLSRVSSRYLEFNNRLGSKGTPEEKPEAPPVPPEDPEAQVSAQILREQDADPECAQMVSEYQTLNAELGKLGDEASGLIGTLRSELAKVNTWLDLDEIKQNPLRVEELTNKARELSLDLARLRSEKATTRLNIRDLEMRYEGRAGLIERSLRGTLEQRAAIQRRTQELAKEWPALVQRVADNAKLPKGAQAKFFKAATDRFVLSTRAGVQIPNLEEFLTSIAKERLEEMDEYHRIQSAEYGELAKKRADTVSPATASVPGAPGAAPASNQPKSLNELYANVEREIHSVAR